MSAIDRDMPYMQPEGYIQGVTLLIEELKKLRLSLDRRHLRLIHDGYGSLIPDVSHLVCCLIRCFEALLRDIPTNQEWDFRIVLRPAPANSHQTGQLNAARTVIMLRREIATLPEVMEIEVSRRASCGLETNKYLVSLLFRLSERLKEGSYENFSQGCFFDLVVVLYPTPISITYHSTRRRRFY
ncbi:hypothetical protein CDD81_726 [Ophiocordyceps australis]|uniref:Uncharacterized protein n=1 Tax=Ophiocordyceps australis TaxID=1399860 RepID=A0A2C5XFX4_9HYPO|nr:hypothetical protein CDD81_726 [Ophiocordyceps australis]